MTLRPSGYTGVWLTGGTGYVALHVTPNKVGHTQNFVQFCAYIHPSMWGIRQRISCSCNMAHIKAFTAGERAELHYRISSGENADEKKSGRKIY